MRRLLPDPTPVVIEVTQEVAEAILEMVNNPPAPTQALIDLMRPKRFVGPKSPHNLIQEQLAEEPWKVLVACILLNCTTRKQAEEPMWELFRRWPTPQEFAGAPNEDVAELLRSLGFKNRRTERLKRATAEWIQTTDTSTSTGTSKWPSLTSFTYPTGAQIRGIHGIGEYAARAYEIFCLGELGEEAPDDHALVKYFEWAKSNPTLYQAGWSVF